MCLIVSMKQTIVLLLLMFSVQTLAQETTTFILVRHAEKSKDHPKDPSLTKDGQNRANKFMELFRQSDITAIYSTDYKRTQMTIAPLAEELNLEVQSYGWKDPKGLLSKMLSDHKGGMVVISGHSNTTPHLANILLGKEELNQFDDSDYGNILVITTTELGSGKLLHLRF